MGEAISLQAVSREDDVTFWSHQMSEHALFLHLLMEEKALKERGLMLHKKWEEFRKHYKQNKECAKVELCPLITETRNYKTEILNRLLAGEWLGWAFPLFVDHVRRELDYFNLKYQGKPLSPPEEIVFWDEIMADHAAFEAHLLDPIESESIIMASNLEREFRNLPQTDLNQFLILSIQYTKELDTFQESARRKSKAGQLKSIIHPTLVDHVIREAKRAASTLNSLQGQIVSTCP